MTIRYIVTLSFFAICGVALSQQCTDNVYKMKIGDKWFTYNSRISKKDIMLKPVALQCEVGSPLIDIGDYEWATPTPAKVGAVGYRGYGFVQFSPIVNKLDTGTILIFSKFKKQGNMEELTSPRNFVLHVY